MIDKIFAFPDTNVFLHYKPLAQIDWCRFLDARSVTMVICLPVVQELDEKKSDPRLVDRARRAIKEIEEHYSGAKPLRAGVTLEIFNEQLRRDEFQASLSPDSQDDRIVHLVRKYVEAHPDRTTCVLTEDLGMVLRCGVGGVTSRRMEESDRLENPGEEKDRKLKQVQGELASLKNRLPKLSLSVFPPDQDPSKAEQFRCVLSDDWTELDAEVEVEKQRMEFPKHTDRIPSRIYMPVAELFESHISTKRWEQYDAELDSYFVNYEIYVNRLNTWGANNARTISFSVLIQNTGTSPATDIDISLVFPSKIRWLAKRGSSEAAPLQKPKPPSPPERPKSELFAASSMSRDFGGSLESRFTGLGDIALRPAPDEPVVGVILQPKEGHLIRAKLERLKHGGGILLGSFFAVLGSWNDVSPFEAEYIISTSEHPEKIAGKLPLLVTKASESPERNSEDDGTVDDSAGS